MKGLLAAAFVLLSTPGFAQDARTYVEGLELDTAEEAVGNFIDAFRRSDYFAAYHMLTPDAQMGFQDAIDTFNLGVLLPGVTFGPRDLPSSTFFSQDSGQEAIKILFDASLLFDDTMLAAEKDGKLPFTFGNGAAFTVSPIADGEALASVTTGETPPTLDVKLRLLPNGDWKVNEIAWEGSLHGKSPWALP